MTWQLDSVHSSVEFAVRHMMVSTVKGRFRKFNVDLDPDEADPTRSRVAATIDAASIDTGEEQRDGHLRSADFLDADQFPVITFRSRRVEPVAGNRYRVIGDLTIRDVTREVVLDAEYSAPRKDPYGKTRAGFSASTAINRKDFGASWNVPLDAGGVLVGEDARIDIALEVVKQE